MWKLKNRRRHGSPAAIYNRQASLTAAKNEEHSWHKANPRLYKLFKYIFKTKFVINYNFLFNTLWAD